MKHVSTRVEGLSYRMRPSKTDLLKKDKVWYGRFMDKTTGKQREVLLDWRDYDGMSMAQASVRLIGFMRNAARLMNERIKNDV